MNFHPLSHSSILLVALVLLGCASQPLKPIPLRERQIVQFDTLRDLTSQYPHLKPSFEILVKAAITRDFVLVPNHEKFTEHKFDICQIPLRAADDTTGEVPQFIVNGDVERISYEPARDIDDRITTYAFFGLLGLALSTDNDMAVFLQYRFYVSGQNSTPIDTFVVYGVAAGDPASVTRDRLAQRANGNASCLFAAQLVEGLARKGYLRPKMVRYSRPITPDILERCAELDAQGR